MRQLRRSSPVPVIGGGDLAGPNRRRTLGAGSGDWVSEAVARPPEEGKAARDMTTGIEDPWGFERTPASSSPSLILATGSQAAGLVHTIEYRHMAGRRNRHPGRMSAAARRASPVAL
jgi:hypothetical protein